MKSLFFEGFCFGQRNAKWFLSRKDLDKNGDHSFIRIGVLNNLILNDQVIVEKYSVATDLFTHILTMHCN